MNGSPPEQHDVIVVGAGPVGLTLALGLLRRGIDVIVLEKNPGTAEHSRAPGIWSPTQEILAGLGVIGRFETEGISLPRVEVWDADRDRMLLRLPVEELRGETAYPRLLIVPQSKTEHFLHEAIRDAAAGERVRFSCEVLDVKQSDGGVDVTYATAGREQRMRARFLAGCDGARSTVREAIDGSLEGITYRVQAALADVVLALDEDFRFPRLSTRPSLAMGIRIDTHLWRLILPFSPHREQPPLDERIARAVRSLFDRDEYEVTWKSEFQLHRRVSSRWVDGRIVLAGDAAHLNSPVGGQGMNAGIGDAAALTDALAEALRVNDPAPLSDYVARRRRMVERGVNPFTDRLTRLLLSQSGRVLRFALRSASLLTRVPPLRRAFLRKLAMLDHR